MIADERWLAGLTGALAGAVSSYVVQWFIALRHESRLLCAAALAIRSEVVEHLALFTHLLPSQGKGRSNLPTDLSSGRFERHVSDLAVGLPLRWMTPISLHYSTMNWARLMLDRLGSGRVLDEKDRRWLESEWLPDGQLIVEMLWLVAVGRWGRLRRWRQVRALENRLRASEAKWSREFQGSAQKRYLDSRSRP